MLQDKLGGGGGEWVELLKFLEFVLQCHTFSHLPKTWTGWEGSSGGPPSSLYTYYCLYAQSVVLAEQGIISILQWNFSLSKLGLGLATFDIIIF